MDCSGVLAESVRKPNLTHECILLEPYDFCASVGTVPENWLSEKMGFTVGIQRGV